MLLVTGLQARDIIEGFASQLRRVLGCGDIHVVALRIPIASMISTRLLAEQLPRLVPDYRRYYAIIVPGTSLVDPAEASRLLGVRVVKGPKNPGDLAAVLRALLEGDERLDYSEVTGDVLEESRRVFSRARRRCVDGACVYMHPAYTLVVEVAPGEGRGFEELVAEVAASRPHFVVFGDEEWLGDDEFRSMLSRFVELVGSIPFGVETRRVERMLEALDYGARLVAGVSPSALRELRRYSDSAFFTLVPYNEERGIYPRDSHEKTSLLLEALKKAREYGYEHIILDPIVVPPPHGFVDSLEPYRVIRDAWRDLRGERYPLLFSLASLEDALGTDPFHVYLFGSLIGYELEASVYWVVAKRGVEVEEARAALDVALASYTKSATPRTLGLDLSLLGMPHSPPPPRLRANAVEVERVEPSELERRYARIWVDDGEVIVEFVDAERGLRRVYRGRDGLSIARRIIRDFGVGPEHAAYLGYELAKAEIAARLHSGYTQDSEVRPPHERIRG